jgi:hypothetical protein
MKGDLKLQVTKTTFIEALRETLGNVTEASRRTGIDRISHYRYLKEDPEYKQQVDEIANMVFDYVESNLYKQIGKGDTPAMNLYFRYSPTAKRRGWQQNLDITTGGEKLNIPAINISIVPPLLSQPEDDNIIDITEE